MSSNLFNFEYENEVLTNKDGSPSRFSKVYGDKGLIIHTKKDSYKIVPTEAFSQIGVAFANKGMQVSTFQHRDGEVIGLNIVLGGKMTKVGDKTFNAYITLPNNGGGKGKLSLKETRLICTNGAVHTLNHRESEIKIPHTVDYPQAIELMTRSLEEFKRIIDSIDEKDTLLTNKPMEKHDIMYHLNKWYYEQEMPANHKSDMGFNEFRRVLAESPDDIQSIARYRELMAALDKEIGYNQQLNLSLSLYTVYATVTNYLSRRVEKSNSSAAEEVQFTRASEKLVYFENLITV